MHLSCEHLNPSWWFLSYTEKNCCTSLKIHTAYLSFSMLRCKCPVACWCTKRASVSFKVIALRCVLWYSFKRVFFKTQEMSFVLWVKSETKYPIMDTLTTAFILQIVKYWPWLLLSILTNVTTIIAIFYSYVEKNFTWVKYADVMKLQR